MSGLSDRVYSNLPNFLQNLLVSTYNILAYRKRYGGDYKLFREKYRRNNTLELSGLTEIQEEKKNNFLNYVLESSVFYQRIYRENNNDFPILSKEELRQNIKTITTIDKSKAIASKTGGTTGKSLEVLFSKRDMQDRFAMLDNFRAKFGYELGEKTAWFSGKDLLTNRDLEKNRFWKTDYYYKVRYYSTFHIKDDYLKYYVEDLIKFKPEFIVGFPSSILEIAKFGLRHGYDFPANVLKAVFPTAETITDEMRITIEKFFKTNLYNQYASSEGAPFIFECEKHKLHLELQSGVFELSADLEEDSTRENLIVTSFSTHGTPLVRYDIGDVIELTDTEEKCTCGNNNPIIKNILGRVDDYVYSPQNGKINLGNVSNTLKGTTGIVKFQVIQDSINALVIKIIIDSHLYNKKVEETFIKNWKQRVGDEMLIDLQIVNDIPSEKSGKYRIVKNNIKHIIENKN